MDNRFSVFIENNDLRVRTKSALDEAERVAAQSDYNNKGAVFCQIKRTFSGELEIVGTFIEPEYASQIDVILQKRKSDQDNQKP